MELNNIATQSTPWPFQVVDSLDDVIVPISLFIGILIAIQLSPRNKYTIAFANGTLIFVATRYIIWRLLTINTAHALSFAMSLLIYLYELLLVVILYAEFIPSTSYEPSKRKLEADNYQATIHAEKDSVDIGHLEKRGIPSWQSSTKKRLTGAKGSTKLHIKMTGKGSGGFR